MATRAIRRKQQEAQLRKNLSSLYMQYRAGAKFCDVYPVRLFQ